MLAVCFYLITAYQLPNAETLEDIEKLLPWNIQLTKSR